MWAVDSLACVLKVDWWCPALVTPEGPPGAQGSRALQNTSKGSTGWLGPLANTSRKAWSLGRASGSYASWDSSRPPVGSSVSVLGASVMVLWPLTRALLFPTDGRRRQL